MSKLFAVAVLAMGLGACSALAPSALSAPPAATHDVDTRTAQVSCTISATRSAHGLVLQPLVRSPLALAGDYEFTLTKGGGSGSSDVSQGGPLSLNAGEQAALGASEINADGRVRAHLSIRDGARVVCSADYRN